MKNIAFGLILGVVVAITGFFFWQYYTLKKDVDSLSTAIQNGTLANIIYQQISQAQKNAK